MHTYYALRLAISAAAGGAFVLGGLPWWIGVPVSILMLFFFFAAPRSGRYVVRTEGGPTPLRRDERGQTIADKAARNGFIAIVIAMGGLTIAYGSFLEQPVPVAALGSVLGLGLALALAVYALSDARQRHARAGKLHSPNGR
jgi:hypothetical protein